MEPSKHFTQEQKPAILERVQSVGIKKAAVLAKGDRPRFKIVDTDFHYAEIRAKLEAAGTPRGAEKLWHLLWTGVEGPAVPVDAQPDAPWCAVRLELGILADLPAAEWLGDFERCLAWTWLERQ